MDIRDLSLLDRSQSWLAELLEFTKKGGRASGKSPNLAAVHRHANALKDAVDRLGKSLQEAGPPPQFVKEKPPLYLRISEHRELGEIARKVGHYGCHEDDFYALTRQLAHTYGGDRVSDAMFELTWTEKEHRWVKLRPEVIRSLRPFIGPVPGAEDYEFWWKDRGGPPEPRGPGYPRPEKKPAREVVGSDEDVARAVQEARSKKSAQALKAMLTRARKGLKNAGTAEWIVRSAEARIKAATEEMPRRNLEVPEEKA